MKLRYYLRGIGLGIMVTAAICICATLRNNKTEMTDAQIKERAASLGMVESGTTLSDVAANTEASAPSDEYVVVEPEEIDVSIVEDAGDVSDDNSDVDDAFAEDIVTSADVVEEPGDEEAAFEEEEPDTVEEEASEAPAVAEAEGEVITIVVDKGNGSDTVARKLQDAGIVANAAEYDRYLMANGYDRRIAAGTHKLRKGMSDEEIAKLLVTKQD